MTIVSGFITFAVISNVMAGAVPQEAPGLLESALNVFGSLVIVLCVLLIGLYASKRFLRPEAMGSRPGLMRVLGSIPLGMKKSVALVEVPGSVLVLGVSQESISLLSKVESRDLEKVLKECGQEEPSRPGWNHLKVFSSPGPAKAEGPPRVLSFVKGKILDLRAFRRMRLRPVRLGPATAGKDGYE